MNANPLAQMGDSVKHSVRRFADGGKPETAEDLLKRLSGKYNIGGAAPTTPAPAQPAPQAISAPAKQPAPTISGAVNALKNRKQQIDQAVDGYASGGKISGPGTPTSDSIPAQVNETGEPIAVSTDERILSSEQDAFMEKLARDLGFAGLDAMLEAGTGQPVGPTIKAGKMAAADGLQPEQNPLISAMPQLAPIAQSTSPVVTSSAYQMGSTADPRAVNPLAAMTKPDAPYHEAERNSPAPNLVTPIDSLFPTVKRYANGGTFDPNRDYSVPEEQQIAAKQAIASAPAYTPPVAAPIDPAKNFRNTDFSMAAADPKGFEAVRKTIAPGTSTAAQASAAIRSPSAAPQIQPGVQERTFPATTSPIQGATNPLLNDNYRPTSTARVNSFTETGTKENQTNPLTTIGMNANNESLAKANAIRQSMIDGDGTGPKVAMLGNSGLSDTQALMDKWGREDGTASAMQAAVGNPNAAAAIASILSTQQGNETDRFGHQLNRQTSADTNTVHQQGQQLDANVTMRGQDINAQTASANREGNPLTNALTKTQTAAIQSGLDDKKAAAAMLAEIQNEKTTPERRHALKQAYLLAQGKDPSSKFIVVPGGEYTDPENPLLKMKEPSRIFNTETQQIVGAPSAAPSIPQQAVALLKSNPGMAADFDKKYGEGASIQFLGGQQTATAIPPADRRVVGQTYQTPKGPMIWRGTGWEATRS